MFFVSLLYTQKSVISLLLFSSTMPQTQSIPPFFTRFLNCSCIKDWINRPSSICIFILHQTSTLIASLSASSEGIFLVFGTQLRVYKPYEFQVSRSRRFGIRMIGMIRLKLIRWRSNLPFMYSKGKAPILDDDDHSAISPLFLDRLSCALDSIFAE